MSSRLIFEDMFTFVFSKGRRSLYSGRKHYLNGILTQNSMYKNRKICTSSSGIYTKGNQISLSQPFPIVYLHRLYQRDNSPVSNRAKIWRKLFLRVVRGIFLATGGLVWFVAFFAYWSLEKVNVDFHDERGAGGSGLNVLERKLMNHFYKEKDEGGILRKDDALDRVWRKLNQEERVKEVFGNPVYICGYNYSNKIGDLFDQIEDSSDKLTKGVEFGEEKLKETDNVKKENEKEEEHDEKEEEHDEKGNESGGENGKIWEAGCYIEGSKKVGLLTVKFEECNREWVPVALHLETMEKSGQVISDVSASLPNGLKNFTRLSN